MSTSSISYYQLEDYIQQLEKRYKKEVHEIQIAINNEIKLTNVLLDQIFSLLQHEKNEELQQSMKDYIESESEKVKRLMNVLEKILTFSDMQRKSRIQRIKKLDLTKKKQ